MYLLYTFSTVKLIGKLQDGTVFLKKGHNEGEELFEFKTDEGNRTTLLPTIFFSFMILAELACLIFIFVSEQVIDGLDRAVMGMKKGEVAQLTIAPEYAFGSSESQQELAVVPPNSTVYYEVELASFVKVLDERCFII